MNFYNNMEKAVTSQRKGILTKFTNFSLKNKRIAAIAGLTTLLFGGIGYLIGKTSGKDDVQSTKDTDNNTPIISGNIGNNDSTKTTDSQKLKGEKDSVNNLIVNNDVDELNSNQALVSQDLTNDSIAGAKVPDIVTDSIADAKVPVEEPVKSGKKAEKHFQLDENGEYITVKGDNFWDIAEEYLKNKYKNEPEKFENLTQNEKTKKIYKETLRILFLNGYDIEEINPNDPEGKMRNSLPALQPRIKIKFTQSLNQAA